MNEIFRLLNPNNTVTVNRPLAHAIGLNAAIIYAALLAKCHYYTENDMLYEDEWFYSTANDLFESTALSEKQQRLCVDDLVKLGLIECRRMGMPAKRYFRVVDDVGLLEKYIGQGEEMLAKLKPCSCQRAEQEPPEGQNKNLPKGGTCSDERAEQEPPEGQNKNSQKVGTCSDERAEHTYKTKDNKSKAINPNQSIYPAQAPDVTDRIDNSRKEYFDIIRENIDYDYFADKKQVDELVEIMLDVVCSNESTIRVNGAELPHEAVKRRFLRLSGSHIEYILTALKRSPSDIRNIRAYLITALYNAPSTMDSYYRAWVNHDMYGT